MKHTPSFMQFFGRALAVSGVALLCFSSQAEAGFEWRGPLEPPVRKAAPAPVQGDMSGLEPVMSWDGTSPAPAAVAAPTEPVEASPVSPALAPFAATAPAPVAAMDVSGDVVAGFGRDLPLVIALQQVAPAGHQFSFASGVNPGAMVSWEGGKPWQAVLNDMLAPQGLGFQQQGNVIVVGPFSTDSAVLSPQAADAAAQMSSMPQDDDMSAPVSLAAPQTAPAAAAPAPAPSGEPVTIRRSRAEAPADSRTAGSQPAATAAPSETKQAVMSYPPETAGSRPVPVTSLPPAATNAPLSEPSADLAVPPPMNETMSPAPEAAAAPVPLVETPVAAAAPQAEEAKVVAAPQKSGAPWGGTKGATLRDTLKNWSDAANVELYWSIDYDYKLKGDVNYAGSYDEAVGKLLDQFAAVRPQPYGQLHQSKDGPRVLVVKSYDLTP
ncbi:MAG: TcpQ domain-containing protein [Alphaproteobacteria bacterium]|nr:TcpQ domain-containing protein [Alphaproteobacteria bacterium]